MKKFLISLLVIIGVLGGTALIVVAPKIVEQQQIKESQVAPYTIERYYAWAKAYDALQKSNDTLYSSYPDEKEHPDEYTRAIQREYPKKYLPDMIQEFGIVVQKEYSSNYIFLERKSEMQTYTSNLMKQVKSAKDGYISVDNEPNANDANVLVALEKYYALLEKLNFSIEELTQEQAKTGALGKYIQDNVGEKLFSDPIAYGQVAQSYLKANLDRYANNFKNRENDGELTNEQAKEVETIMWLNKE